MEKDQVRTVFKVTGMDCADEVSAIQNALDVHGVRSVNASIMSSTVAVDHAASLSPKKLKTLIESSGVAVQSDDGEHDASSDSLRIRITSVAASGLFLGGSLASAYMQASISFLQTASAFASIVFASYLILPKALRSVRSKNLDMNLLVMIALFGAIIIKEYAEGATVVFLFSLAELLESLSLRRARRSVESLLKLAPDTAWVKRDSALLEVPVAEVAVGEIVFVKSGEKIPLDGEILKGASNINQAPITGESIPVYKKTGDKVLAGTLNQESSLEIKVTGIYNNTKLSQIIQLIEEAQEQKAPTQRFVDRFAAIYTPAIFVLAVVLCLMPPLLFGADWNVWFYRSLVLLVVACPCALVISTPVSIVSGLTAMARKGILIKGGGALEMIGKLQALAVDKTGTITQGRPKLISVTPYNFESDQVLAIAAAIDSHSTHPLATAVTEAAIERGIHVPQSEGYQSHTGRGAEAVIDGHIYFVGNHKFAHDNAACNEEVEKELRKIEDLAQSVVIVGHRPHAGCTGKVLGVIAIADPIRDRAAQAVEKLHQIGLKAVVMLSGDNEKTVAAIAKQVGIDEAYGDLLPAEKVLRMSELKRRLTYVGMVGDGVNDAPAMATASLGIAMGASGTDTAIETADVTLMHDQLSGVADAISMGKRTMNVIWFNTAFAILVKLAFLGLSIFGAANLWTAIAADTGATILVIANSLRLLK